MQLLQVVGYKNSGKTTLIEILVKELAKRGFRAGTLKHHGHGGKPKLPPRADSTRHAEAGALVAGVEGEGTLQLTVQLDPGWKLEEVIRLYTFFALDLLLLEGFKSAPFPKLVCLRHEGDAGLLDLPEVVAAFSFNRELASCFDICDPESYMKTLIMFLNEEPHAFHRQSTV